MGGFSVSRVSLLCRTVPFGCCCGCCLCWCWCCAVGGVAAAVVFVVAIVVAHAVVATRNTTGKACDVFPTGDVGGTRGANVLPLTGQ